MDFSHLPLSLDDQEALNAAPQLEPLAVDPPFATQTFYDTFAPDQPSFLPPHGSVSHQLYIYTDANPATCDTPNPSWVTSTSSLSPLAQSCPPLIQPVSLSKNQKSDQEGEASEPISPRGETNDRRKEVGFQHLRSPYTGTLRPAVQGNKSNMTRLS